MKNTWFLFITKSRKKLGLVNFVFSLLSCIIPHGSVGKSLSWSHLLHFWPLRTHYLQQRIQVYHLHVWYYSEFADKFCRYGTDTECKMLTSSVLKTNCIRLATTDGFSASSITTVCSSCRVFTGSLQ